jgi:hypothetical protein
MPVKYAVLATFTAPERIQNTSESVQIKRCGAIMRQQQLFSAGRALLSEANDPVLGYK